MTGLNVSTFTFDTDVLFKLEVAAHVNLNNTCNIILLIFT